VLNCNLKMLSLYMPNMNSSCSTAVLERCECLAPHRDCFNFRTDPATIAQVDLGAGIRRFRQISPHLGSSPAPSYP